MIMKDKEKAQLKLILALELKITHIKEYVEKEILELKKINIHSPDISTEEASHNVGAVKYLTKVVALLEKDSKEFFG